MQIHTHASQEGNGGLYCVWDLQVSLRGPSQAENSVFWCFLLFHFYVTSNRLSLAVQTQQRNKTSTLNRGDFSSLIPLSSSEVREIMDSVRTQERLFFWGGNYCFWWFPVELFSKAFSEVILGDLLHLNWTCSLAMRPLNGSCEPLRTRVVVFSSRNSLSRLSACTTRYLSHFFIWSQLQLKKLETGWSDRMRAVLHHQFWEVSRVPSRIC